MNEPPTPSSAPGRSGSDLPPGPTISAGVPFRPSNPLIRLRRSVALRLLLAALLTLLGLLLHWPLLAVPSALLLLGLCLAELLPDLWRLLADRLDEAPLARLLAIFGLVVSVLALPLALGWFDRYLAYYRNNNWEAIGAIGEGVIGAFGQILVALVAVAIAWRQVLIEQRLTTQQNRITQAQTIDSFIQGISELIVDEEGMLEDWPLERMLAEGRLAAVFGSIDTEGRARVLRFLSHARLLTPLRRDTRLGRAILDGHGNYEEDRIGGVPVIQLHALLKGADLSGTDLRGVDFNGADLRNSDLAGCDLSGANLAATNLAGANLEQARLEDTRFFYGRAQGASPCRPDQAPDLQSGWCSGAVVENANLSGVQRLDPETHLYLACWSGSRSRASLPGGSKGITNLLETARPSPRAGGVSPDETGSPHPPPT